MFWPPIFFGGGRNCTLVSKAHPDSDHVAKFYNDRTRELGDLTAK